MRFSSSRAAVAAAALLILALAPVVTADHNNAHNASAESRQVVLDMAPLIVLLGLLSIAVIFGLAATSGRPRK